MPAGRPRKYIDESEQAAVVRQRAIDWYYRNQKQQQQKRRKAYEESRISMGATYHPYQKVK